MGALVSQNTSCLDRWRNGPCGRCVETRHSVCPGWRSMEIGGTMGKKCRNMDKNLKRRFWGLRPWKRHSAILMVAGVLYILIGLSYVLDRPNSVRDKSLVVLLQLFPLAVWGVIFIFVGVVTCISSRWPPFHETWGYTILTGLSSMWMTAYFTGFLFYHAQSLSGAILWGLVAFMWWAISGLLNPDKTGAMSRGPD